MGGFLSTQAPDAVKLPATNNRWVLTRRPVGAFNLATDCDKVVEEMPALEAGEILVKVEMLSVDAFVRTMLDDEAYHGRVELGAALPCLGYGTVVAADDPKAIGKRVSGMCGAQEYVKGTLTMESFNGCFPGVHPRLCLSLLSPATGLAAYVGCFKVLAPPKKGETAVVSAASGGVGSIAAQLLKSTGCRVVGVAGGARKCAFLREQLGVEAVDYKSPTFGADLDAACPDGIDFFFDGAGGSTLDAVLDRINLRSRVVVCGAASQYSGALNAGRTKDGRGGSVRGPATYLKLAEKSSTMSGYNVMHYLSSLPGAIVNLLWMHYRGTLVIHEQVEAGLDAFPAALMKLFSGGATGKLLVDVATGDRSIKLSG
mmetsp:Transcript_25365/g.76177  ORF Transcript_25365/g.76177 Transcript_25365/m.76177 type:complete len:371 (-) Transcript_25365:68-1180(-)|eukprot:CAMPEP_0119261014 /NCGR_PEP_ID=MMETSP1329-20130426/1209_1 /TAXON_ID=114041 /ORGANISM="Genus nov. species nov., Strain RCC1024" /LENGTH=370 /DNA_ID=CAMNT_0007260509 /DNA_START=148 /DNA_END=1260 /DNA_ORIENTATION=-